MPQIHYPRPAFTTTDAVALAATHFGLTATASELAGERDRNFRLDTVHGSFVLKIAPAGETRAELELQHAALAHLATRAPELGLQRVVPARSGATLVTIEAPAEVASRPPDHAAFGAAPGQLVPAPVGSWESPQAHPPAAATVLPPAPGGPRQHFARLLTYLPGTVWAEVRPHSTALLRSLGGYLGALDRNLADFDAPAAERPLKWDLRQAGWIRNHLGQIDDPLRRALVERWLGVYDQRVRPALEVLRQGVIYNDANDHNVLVSPPGPERRVCGLIDFGDLCRSNLVCEPAIAAAYAAMGLADPLSGIAELVAGYHAEHLLTADELAVLHPLVCMRLAVSVTNAAIQRSVEPANPYLAISEQPAWELLERLSAIPERLALATYRDACGLPAHPDAPRLLAWLDRHRGTLAPIVEPDLATAPLVYVDWSVGSRALGSPEDMADAAEMERRIAAQRVAAGAVAAIGGYDEARPVYASDAFRHRGNDRDEWRTVHLGLDVFLPASSPVFTPLDGVVHSVADNAARFDYGPTIVLTHTVEDEHGPLTFHTLWGHLSRASLAGLAEGQPVRAGEPLATLGSYPENGDWAPHLHLQIVLDMFDRRGDFIGSCRPSQRRLWTTLCPDPNLLARVPAALLPPPPPTTETLLARRRAVLGQNLSLAYRPPLAIVRGFRQWLWDQDGQRFLDAYNNVPHVGHNHPRVVRAVAEQLAVLNTNTRYLHPALLDYAERLVARLPAPLAVVYFTASGSEANELALRLARAHTRAKDLLVMAGAYHGHTTTLIDCSPYKHDGPGGEGPPDWVHRTVVPDVYRGAHRARDGGPRRDAAAFAGTPSHSARGATSPAEGPPPSAAATLGERYAAEVAAVVDRLTAHGRRIAGYLAETLPSVGGQTLLPEGFLPAVYAAVRAAGGVAIADEVQTGFGRTGSHFWAFERYGVVPDIVVLGKPIANGYPMGAVITTREIAASFANGMEYFSTFGGSTAAVVAAGATLDVLEDEALQTNAAEVGDHLLAGLHALAARHPILGDVRGAGLFLGVELVRDRITLEPADREASTVVDRLRDRGILIGTDGPLHNVLKIRPPLCFTRADAERLLEALDAVLGEDAVRV
jgi:4-aminobutyrate aminotransferase-like enzyme/Ser/Thr protein kinase RdoA (MazF antagonist)